MEERMKKCIDCEAELTKPATVSERCDVCRKERARQQVKDHYSRKKKPTRYCRGCCEEMDVSSPPAERYHSDCKKKKHTNTKVVATYGNTKEIDLQEKHLTRGKIHYAGYNSL